MFGSSKLQDSRFYLRVSFEVIKKFAPAINSEKCSKTDLMASAKLYRKLQDSRLYFRVIYEVI